jgi:hypothetical protein
MLGHLKRLEMKRIHRIVQDKDFGEPVYGLRFTDGAVAWIMRDPEGNGTGFLEIEEPA